MASHTRRLSVHMVFGTCKNYLQSAYVYYACKLIDLKFVYKINGPFKLLDFTCIFFLEMVTYRKNFSDHSRTEYVNKSDMYVTFIVSNKLHSGSSSARFHLKTLHIFIQTYCCKIRFNIILQSFSINY